MTTATQKTARVGDWSLRPVAPIDHAHAHAPANATAHLPPPNSDDFSAIYDAWFDEVSRWVRAMGGPDADRDDLVQDIFVVVHRRLADFDGQNLPGWLYRIAMHRVRDFRRLRWVKLVFKGGAPISDQLPSAGPSPAGILESKEKRLLIERFLSKLGEPQRVAFVLFEVEGRSGEEIARLQRVPLNTVWARIRRARKKMRAQLVKAGIHGDGTADGDGDGDGKNNGEDGADGADGNDGMTE
jgi:RNA polymerase sigma-70 factor (ECF subfamily)